MSRQTWACLKCDCKVTDRSVEADGKLYCCDAYANDHADESKDCGHDCQWVTHGLGGIAPPRPFSLAEVRETASSITANRNHDTWPVPLAGPNLGRSPPRTRRHAQASAMTLHLHLMR